MLFLLTNLLRAESVPVRLDSLGDPLPAGAVGRLGSSRLFHPGQVHAIAFAPDGKTFASCGSDRTARLWETATGKELNCFSGFDGEVFSMAFCPNGKTLAAATSQEIYLLNPSTGECHARWFTDQWALQLNYSPDGQTLISTGVGGVRCWDAGTGQPLRWYHHPVWSWGHTPAVALSPDGNRLAFPMNGGLGVCELTSGELRRIPTDRTPSYLAFVAGGKQLVSVVNETIQVRDSATGKEVQPQRLPRGATYRLAFASDGKRFVCSTNAAIGDLTTGERVKLRPNRGKTSWSILVFSPDGKTLATPAAGAESNSGMGIRGKNVSPFFFRCEVPTSQTAATPGWSNRRMASSWLPWKAMGCSTCGTA